MKPTTKIKQLRTVDRKAAKLMRELRQGKAGAKAINKGVSFIKEVY